MLIKTVLLFLFMPLCATGNAIVYDSWQQTVAAFLTLSKLVHNIYLNKHGNWFDKTGSLAFKSYVRMLVLWGDLHKYYDESTRDQLIKLREELVFAKQAAVLLNAADCAYGILCRSGRYFSTLYDEVYEFIRTILEDFSLLQSISPAYAGFSELDERCANLIFDGLDWADRAYCERTEHPPHECPCIKNPPSLTAQRCDPDLGLCSDSSPLSEK